MQLEHAFTVPVTVDKAWEVLLDIERVAPCMPGAALESVDGDDFTGSVKVRLGPIGLTYKGKASFIEKDEVAHRAVIDAQGKDSRGNGTAAAKVTATLVGEGETTKVVVVTDLNITGKPAQFGRGVMVDVGNKLIGQFADCLAGKLAAGDTPVESIEDVPTATEAAPGPSEEGAHAASTAAPTAAPTAPPTVRSVPRQLPPPISEVEPIDLLGSAGPAVAKRLIPLAIPLLLIIFYLVRRRRG
ncbi:SRPBCC family protein [soil metagenome]